MSRSLHTQKLEIRAHRRSVRPYSTRRDEAEYLRGRKKDRSVASQRHLAIKDRKPLPGTWHPLSPWEIDTLLTIIGPVSRYGLKSIQLRKESALRPGGIVFAEYAVPGEIHLFALPALPWSLPFLLHAVDRTAFETYGARIEVDLEREQTIVSWSPSGLKRFALYEVLAHEIGHHLLQTHKGKRTVTICRRSDHERRAELQSERVKRIVAAGHNSR